MADVLSGDVVAGELVKAACDRHLRDIDRQGASDFPYYFDANAASVACDFYPLVLKHSIGECAGLPFILEPWQIFGIASIFGWKHAETHARRFRKVYWSMARKNGKSCIGAGLALFLASLDVNPVSRRPEDVAEIVLSATKREQVTKVIYAEILRMRMATKLREVSTAKNNQTQFFHNQGFIHCVGSDKAFDGLNPHGVIMDELHEWKETVHRKFYDTMQTGSGNRVQPITITVTTAGDDHSYIWLGEYKYAKGVVADNFKDERLFSLCYELDEKDDPLDEDVWLKANPNLGVSVKLEYLRDQAREAQHSKLTLNRFVRYHGNRIVAATTTAFDMQEWDACEGELSDWADADAVGAGVDLGGRDDLAAYAVVARFELPEDQQPERPDDDWDENWRPLYRYEVKTKQYIAETTERDLTIQPFFNFVDRELLRVCKHPIRELRDDLVASCWEYNVEDVAYDPAGGQSLAEDVENEGIEIASMSQTYRMFHEPIGDFMAALEAGRVTHNGCPLLRWAVSNAVVVQDRQQRWMFDKKSSSEKIDPVIAMVMAFRRAYVAPPKAEGKLFITG